MQRIQQSLSQESKSTAGDKHETGRAMIQLEREKLGNQLKELELQERLLAKIPIEEVPAQDFHNQRIVAGSCVETDHLNYYLSISLGEISVSDKVFYAISLQTPIAKLLLGKTIGDTIVFNGMESEILKIH